MTCRGFGDAYGQLLNCMPHIGHSDEKCEKRRHSEYVKTDEN